MSALNSWLSTVAANTTKTNTLYEVTDLALMGSDSVTDDPARFIVASPFHALPFFDSVTRLTQVRARWLDHSTGTFLTVDPLGYRDSSNLYAYCAGDPVNRRDPTGLADSGFTALLRDLWHEGEYCASHVEDEGCTDDATKAFTSLLGDSAPQRLQSYGYGEGSPIIYVNGIGTTKTRSEDMAAYLAELEHREVIPVWNPPLIEHPKNLLQTVASATYDIAQTVFVNKADVPDATTKILVRTIREELTRHGIIMIVAHSQGAAVTASALDHLLPTERQRIDVITLGGASFSYPKDLKSLRVIANIKDLVPWISGYLAEYGIRGGPAELHRENFGSWRGVITLEGHNVEKYINRMHGELARERAKSKVH